jgi:hypothetical protein
MGPGIGRVAQRHPVATFFVLAFGLTWLVWVPRAAAQGLPAVLSHAAGDLWGVVLLLPAGEDATPALLRIGVTWLLALGVTAATGARYLTRAPVAATSLAAPRAAPRAAAPPRGPVCGGVGTRACALRRTHHVGPWGSSLAHPRVPRRIRGGAPWPGHWLLPSARAAPSMGRGVAAGVVMVRRPTPHAAAGARGPAGRAA